MAEAIALVHGDPGSVMRLVALLFLLVLAVPAFAVDRWPYEAECEKWNDVRIPPKDIGKAPRTCNAELLYYGKDDRGTGRDDVAARHCAYRERAAGQDYGRPFSGSGVLMMLYANGRGVARNIPLARRFACEYEGAPAEVEARLQHLDELALHPDAQPFEICDDITSGMMMGFCADKDADVAHAARERRWTALQASWTPAQRSALAALRKAAGVFFDDVSSEETDMSGTARAAMSIAAYEGLDVGMLADVERFERGRLPRSKAGDFAAADAALNGVYRKVLASFTRTDPRDVYGTVTADGIRTTQRSWLRYREAWVRLGQARYPTVPADAWRAWLSVARTKMLQDFQ